jgi:hypothetical protein
VVQTYSELSMFPAPPRRAILTSRSMYEGRTAAEPGITFGMLASTQSLLPLPLDADTKRPRESRYRRRTWRGSHTAEKGRPSGYAV